MQLIANNFECFPTTSSAYNNLSSLIARLGGIAFLENRAVSNSQQRTSDFDEKLGQKLISLEAKAHKLLLIENKKIDLDLCILIDKKIVAVEIEKSNREKILYDLLKAHIYLRQGADFALILLPRKYIHKSGTWHLFEVGKERYNLSLEFGFGNKTTFDRIMLVGYDVVSAERYT